ncbi:MAG: hypothetical protein EA361_14325 [Bacteroidetes bacterium]|nr:MAG: hypothetical protein EA361_14325 [Bacteroidota bacterium]
MKKLFAIVFIILLINSSVLGQKNDFQGAIYNIGIGGVLGACGALINKGKTEKAGSVIWKGLWQGGMGGYLTFESKRMLRMGAHDEDWKWYWGSRFINAAGTSIKENAALNRDFWESWHMNIGFMRLELHTKDQFLFKPRIMPVTLAYTIGAFVYFDFDWTNSLRTSYIAFSANSTNDLGNRVGFASLGFFVTAREYSDYYTLFSHEIVHLYQSHDFYVLNTLMNKPMLRLVEKYPLVNKLSDLFYLEAPAGILRLAYLYETKRAVNYYDNFFEQEALFYSGPLKHRFD